QGQGLSRLASLYSEALAALNAQRYEEALQRFDDVLNVDPGYRDAAALRKEAARSRGSVGTRADTLLGPDEGGRPAQVPEGRSHRADDGPTPPRGWQRKKLVIAAAAVAAIVLAVVGITIALVYNGGGGATLKGGYTLAPRGLEYRREPRLSSPP